MPDKTDEPDTASVTISSSDISPESDAKSESKPKSKTKPKTEETAKKKATPAPSSKKRRLFRRRAEGEDAEEEGEDEDFDEGEEPEEVMIDYVVKQKPKLTAEQRRLMAIRREINDRKPNFRRQEWFRYQRLGTAYRKPKGLHSKMRKNLKYRSPRARVGYGKPAKVAGLHPSGFQEILVFSVKDLRKVNPKTHAARIGHSVGTKKRIEIEEEADNRGIRILNRGY